MKFEDELISSKLKNILVDLAKNSYTANINKRFALYEEEKLQPTHYVNDGDAGDGRDYEYVPNNVCFISKITNLDTCETDIVFIDCDTNNKHSFPEYLFDENYIVVPPVKGMKEIIKINPAKLYAIKFDGKQSSALEISLWLNSVTSSCRSSIVATNINLNHTMINEKLYEIHYYSTKTNSKRIIKFDDYIITDSDGYVEHMDEAEYIKRKYEEF